MRTTLRAVSCFVVSACLAGTVWAQHGSHTIGTPNDLKWADVPSLPPGAKIAVIEGKMNEAGPITARLKFPANYAVPAHFHPGVERVTVLSGTLNFGMGDKLDRKTTTALGPGGFVIMPVKMNHFVWTKEETIAQINVIGPWTVTYVNPADDPRKK
jgi:anti-sigma factor ChrR (cupin superfamily)